MISCELSYHVAAVLPVSCGGNFPHKSLVLNLSSKGHGYLEGSKDTHQIEDLDDINTTIIRTSHFLVTLVLSESLVVHLH